tara:strand:+ start:6297 stop:6842 length:546 start_codon:yes stop_codon:yes gene_type:complete
MRKITIAIIFLGLFTILFFVLKKGFSTKSGHQANLEVAKIKTSKMPLFEFVNLDSKPFSKYDLTKNKATIIVYFDPDCGLCEKSGKVFSTFKSIHKNANVLFVSHNTKEKILEYQDRFNLNAISNIRFLQCNEDEFYNLFKEFNTPTYFIYNRKQELVKIINDDVPVETVLRYIKVAQIEL